MAVQATSALQLCWFLRFVGEGVVGALAEGAFHAAGERDGAFPELVADAVYGTERLLPFFLFATGEQVELSGALLEAGGADAKQADGPAGLPVLAEEAARGREDLGIELGGVLERVRAGDRREVGVAQLEADGAGVELVLADAARDHLGEARERGLELVGVGGIHRV